MCVYACVHACVHVWVCSCIYVHPCASVYTAALQVFLPSTPPSAGRRSNSASTLPGAIRKGGVRQRSSSLASRVLGKAAPVLVSSMPVLRVTVSSAQGGFDAQVAVSLEGGTSLNTNLHVLIYVYTYRCTSPHVQIYPYTCIHNIGTESHPNGPRVDPETPPNCLRNASDIKSNRNRPRIDSNST